MGSGQLSMYLYSIVSVSTLPSNAHIKRIGTAPSETRIIAERDTVIIVT